MSWNKRCPRPLQGFPPRVVPVFPDGRKPHRTSPADLGGRQPCRRRRSSGPLRAHRREGRFSVARRKPGARAVARHIRCGFRETLIAGVPVSGRASANAAKSPLAPTANRPVVHPGCGTRPAAGRAPFRRHRSDPPGYAKAGGKYPGTCGVVPSGAYLRKPRCAFPDLRSASRRFSALLGASRCCLPGTAWCSRCFLVLSGALCLLSRGVRRSLRRSAAVSPSN